MAFVIADRVRETTTTIGTGSVTLGGAYTSFQTFSAAIGNGNNTYYTIASASSGEWEVGIGTYASGGNLLSRDTVLSSSNAGNLVNFSVGSKDVFVTQPSERSLLINAASNGLFAGNAAFTANGVPYANSTTTLTTGSALTFDGTTFKSPILFASSTDASGNVLQIDTTSTAYGRVGGSTTMGYVAGTQSLWTIGGSEQMRLTSTGLGIGTSSPSNKLVVSNAGANGLEVNPTSGVSSGASLNGYNRSTSAFTPLTYTALSHYFQVGSSPATAATLDSSGNLGIGTNSPLARLHVSQSSTNTAIGTSGAQGLYITNPGTTVNAFSRIDFSGSSNGATASIAAQFTNYTTGATDLVFGTYGGAAILERMRLDSSGNLGIGTSSPAGKLHVAGQTRIQDSANAANYILIGSGANAPRGGNSVMAQTSSMVMGTEGAAPLIFITNATEGMRLDSSGNLGLGVTPSAWGSGYRSLDTYIYGSVYDSAAGNTGTASNAYYNGTNWIYKTNNPAFRFEYGPAGNTGFKFFTAPSGTAGNAITFTQAMTLDASGDVVIGDTATNAIRLSIVKNNPTRGILAHVYNLSYSGQTGAQIQFTQNGIANWVIGQPAGENAFAFWSGRNTATDGAERARITSGGNLLVATTIDAGSPIVYGGTNTIRNVDSAQGGIETNNNAGAASVAGYAMRYIQNVGSGYHAWETSASLAQGAAISYTERARITSGGNFGIGQSSPQTALGFANTATISWGTTNYPFISGDQPNNTLTFGTQATERARIDSSGNLLVGTTLSGIGTARAIVYNDSTNFAGIFANVNATSASTSVLRIYHVGASGGTSAVMLELLNASGSVVGTITSSGTATAYNTSSDYRLKEDVQPMTGALAKVAALKPCTYKWKSDGSAGEGFIAHELAEVVPQAVTGSKDAVNEDGSIKPQGIDTSFLVATLTAAIQELKAEFDAYKATHP